MKAIPIPVSATLRLVMVVELNRNAMIIPVINKAVY
jgi:hypothetical protein